MRVLIVFNHPAPYKVSVFNELSKYVDLTVIFERSKTKDRPSEFYSKNKYNFTAITLDDKNIGNEGSLSNKVRDYIKAHHNDFDYILMNGYSHGAEMKGINYMRKSGIKFGLIINGGIIKNKESIFRKKLKTNLISSASFWISPTKNSDQYLIHYGAKENKIYRYPYSNISNSDILSREFDQKFLRDKYNLPLDKKVFVNASQFIDRKNNFKLIKIFQNRNEHLLLIGEGKEHKKYVNFINKNNIKNITIIPFQIKEKLFEIFKACDTFITLAKEDIFGQTTIEALANGLPVISSKNVNSSLEYIKDGVNGYLVDINDITQVEKSIEKSKDLQRKNAISSVKDVTIEASAKRIYEILSKEK